MNNGGEEQNDGDIETYEKAQFHSVSQTRTEEQKANVVKMSRISDLNSRSSKRPTSPLSAGTSEQIRGQLHTDVFFSRGDSTIETVAANG